MYKKSIILVFIISVVFVCLYMLLPRTSQYDIANTDSQTNGEINLRIDSFSIVLSPLKIAETESLKVASLLYSPLVAVDDKGNVSGRLAKEWKQLDPTTYQFFLHKDLYFTNGDPIKADEVIASLTKAMQPSSPWAWAFSSIKHSVDEDSKTVIPGGLVKKDDYTIQIQLSSPTEWFLYALDSPPGWIFPVNESEGRYGILPGSGSYVLGEVKSDSSIKLIARNDKHTLKAKCSKITFKYIPDALAAAGQFKNGALDILSLTSPELIKQLVSQQSQSPILIEGGNLITAPSQRIRIAIVNTTGLAKKGLTEIEINQLIRNLYQAVDRKRIVSIGGGLLSSALYSSFLPTSSSQLPVPPESREVESLKTYDLSVITEADLYSDQIASIVSQTPIPKIRFSYRSLEKGLLIEHLVNKKYDIAITLIDGNIKSPSFWASFFTPGNPFTIFGKPIAGLATVDLNNQTGIREAGVLINEQGNWVPLTRENRVVAVGPGVSGVRLTTSGQLRFEMVQKEE